MGNIIDRLRAIAVLFRRTYYSRVTFAKVKFDRKAVVLGADVCWRFQLVHSEKLVIGDGTVLNGDCYINAQGGVWIGRYCHIGKGLTLLSSNHNFRSESFVPYDDEDTLKPVKVGDAVWIGANVCIAPGSTIGDGAIIAVGAVVRGNVETCTIVAGNPATVVGRRDKEVFDRLYQQGAFT